MDGTFPWLVDVDGERWVAPALVVLRIVIILVVSWLTIAVLQKLVRAARLRIALRLPGEGAARRAETIGRAARYLVALVVGALGLMMVLAEIGISLAPILGAAGVVGLAVGFGAQSLVKDYFTGFFILFEDQIRTGDVVKVAGVGGLVEDLTLRHVRLRDYDGTVHFIPNSLITSVSNMGRGHAQSVVDVGVAYREDLDEVFAVMRETAVALRLDPVFAPRILGDLELAGVERWDDSAVIVRCRFKVAPLAQWDVRRELLRRLKAAFDERGIEIPYPHVTFYAGTDKQGLAPPVRVQVGAAAGATPPRDAEAPSDQRP